MRVTSLVTQDWALRTWLFASFNLCLWIRDLSGVETRRSLHAWWASHISSRHSFSIQRSISAISKLLCTAWAFRLSWVLCTARSIGNILLDGTVLVIKVGIFGRLYMGQLGLVLRWPISCTTSWLLPFMRRMWAMWCMRSIYLSLHFFTCASLWDVRRTILAHDLLILRSLISFNTLGVCWQELWQIHSLREHYIILVQLNSSCTASLVGFSFSFKLQT